MNLLRRNKKWLRYQTIKLIKEKYKDIFEPNYKSKIRRFESFVTDGHQWWFIVLLVLILFLLSPFINLEFLNFLELDYQTAIYIVDERTTNVAAIVSITLVVVGFILNNLAVKSPLVYGLLFKKSLLYPIIYLTLSVIGVLVIISTLRDTLTPYIFTRLVLTGTYFAVFILLLIGMLFRKVLLFSNEKEIEKMLCDELIIEAKNALKQNLIYKYSGDILQSNMIENGAKEYNWIYDALESPIQTVNDENISEENQREKLLYDVNLNSLSKFVKAKYSREDVLYEPLILDEMISNFNNFIWTQNSVNTKKEKKTLRKSLILKTYPENKRENNAMSKFYTEKLEHLSEQDDYRSMKQVLESYLNLYELQMQSQK